MYLYSRIRALYRILLETKKRHYVNDLILNGLKLGRNVDLVGTFFFDPSHCYLISIGDNCTICPNVRLIAHDASTKKHLGYTKIGRIDIQENCFIGDSVIVLPNVTIGHDSIIGAGSVVRGDIPPRVVVAGNPSKIVSSLEEYLQKIQSIKSSKKLFTKEYLIGNLDEKRRNEIINSTRGSIGFIN